MKSNHKFIYFIIYAVFGVYLLNYALKFWVVPEFLLKIDQWIIFIGGILLIFIGLQKLVKKRTYE